MDNLTIQCTQLTSSEIDKNSFLKSRDSFDREILKIIFKKGFSLRPRFNTVIFLPDCFTTMDRHRIHTFGRKDKCKSKSRDKNGTRQMAICLTPGHVINLVETYFYGK